MSEEIIRFFFKTQNQLKLLHWQTTSYSRHMAYDRIYEDLDEIIDSFVEAYQGKHGRIFLENKTIEVNNIGDDEVAPFVDESIRFLKEDLTSTFEDKDVDLAGIRDELVKQFNTLKYLLTLK
jgi:hypothetical protein